MKPELASVYIYPDKNQIVFVATDSFRLAEKRIKTKKSLDFSPLLVPYKNAAEIIKILEECVGDMEIQTSKNQISILHKNIHITTRVVDGTFPDYSQFIPKNFLTEIIILKQDLLTTLKVANVFSDTYNKINFNIDPSKKTFEIKTKNTNIGEHINSIQSTIQGDIVNLNFNHKYITDCFQSINTDSINLCFNGANKPMVIKGVSDDSFTYIVMPMNK
jgi:DNA polymerase-3 subunit beta